MSRQSNLLFAALATALLISAQQPSPLPGDQPVVPYGWEPAPASCIAEPPNGIRALQGANFASADMTIAKCIAFCDARDFVLAGIEVSLKRPHTLHATSMTLARRCDPVSSDRVSLTI
jgi:hypothetical protein